MKEAFKNLGLVITRPIETFNEMKYKRYFNWLFSGIVVIAWFVVEVLARQLYGFRFNLNNPDDLNIFIQLVSTVIPFVLFCLSNWCICTLFDGEGKFNEIVTYCAYALCPYIVFRALAIPLSRVLTLEEQVFLDWFVIIGILWSVFLLFQGMRIVHQYSSVRTIVMILFTVVGIAIILFMALLLVALFQQVYALFASIIQELLFRR